MIKVKERIIPAVTEVELISLKSKHGADVSFKKSTYDEYVLLAVKDHNKVDGAWMLDNGDVKELIVALQNMLRDVL